LINKLIIHKPQEPASC